MSGKSPDVLASLQEKINRTRAAYQRSTEEYRRLMGVSARVSDPNDPGFADGTYALSQAMKIHTQARRNYERALHDFTDYVLHGKAPDLRE